MVYGVIDNSEMYKLYDETKIAKIIKTSRIAWLGNLIA